MNRLFLGAVAACVLAGGSVAQSADFSAADAASAYNWSGFYTGAHVGYGFGEGEVRYEDYPEDQYRWEPEPDGFFGGVHAGYNHQFSNNLVLGIETDLQAGGISEKAVFIENDMPTYPGWYDGDLELEWWGSTRLRLGYAMDRWMPFITAGAAYGGYEFTLSFDGDGGNHGRSDGTVTGWTLGLGAEYALTERWLLRGSYTYTDFGKETFESYLSDGSFYDGPFEMDLDSHALAFGVSYKF